MYFHGTNANNNGNDPLSAVLPQGHASGTYRVCVMEMAKDVHSLGQELKRTTGKMLLVRTISHCIRKKRNLSLSASCY
jgi:hypothetical protein